MKADAFTRVELLVSLVTIGLLTVVGFSVTADTRERSEQIVCMNNLRQVGRAFHAWAAEHGGDNAWWLSPESGGYRPQGGSAMPPSYYVPGVGTFPRAIVNNGFWHFLWVHEDLTSPSVLVCPSDPAKRRATTFSTALAGFAHPSMQNNALSYLVGLHAVRDFPNEWLSGDRNVITTPNSSGCSSGITGFRSVIPISEGGRGTGWTNGLHVTSGNVLLNDGQVQQMTSRDLNSYENDPAGSDAYVFHLLIP